MYFSFLSTYLEFLEQRSQFLCASQYSVIILNHSSNFPSQLCLGSLNITSLPYFPLENLTNSCTNVDFCDAVPYAREDTFPFYAWTTVKNNWYVRGWNNLLKMFNVNRAFNFFSSFAAPLIAPCMLPMATESQSTPVSSTKLLASPGSVNPWPERKSSS